MMNRQYLSKYSLRFAALLFSIAFLVPQMLCAQSAQRTKAPLSFRGFTPGMTLDSFEAAYNARLETEKKELAKFDGYLDCEKIADGIQRCLDPTDGLTAEFVDNKLSELSWSFSHDEFSSIRYALVAKFGVGKAVSSIVQNAMGATFHDESREWISGAVTLRIDERAARIDKSNATLTDHKLNSDFVKHLPAASPDI